MFTRKFLLHSLFVQLLICCWISLKIFFLPYFIWKWIGSSSIASHIGNLSVLILGTLAILSMGVIGYRQARMYPANRSRIIMALGSMLYIHFPLFLFLIYKFNNGNEWNTYWSSYLSSWLSIITHPMILVGFYGQWLDMIAAFLLCSCYLLGVWIYFDEDETKFTRMKSR